MAAMGPRWRDAADREWDSIVNDPTLSRADRDRALRDLQHEAGECERAEDSGFGPPAGYHE